MLLLLLPFTIISELIHWQWCLPPVMPNTLLCSCSTLSLSLSLSLNPAGQGRGPPTKSQDLLQGFFLLKGSFFPCHYQDQELAHGEMLALWVWFYGVWSHLTLYVQCHEAIFVVKWCCRNKTWFDLSYWFLASVQEVCLLHDDLANVMGITTLLTWFSKFFLSPK